MRVGIPEAAQRRRHHSARLPPPDIARNNGGCAALQNDAGRRAQEPRGGGGHRAAVPRRFLSIAPRAQTAAGASCSRVPARGQRSPTFRRKSKNTRPPMLRPPSLRDLPPRPCVKQRPSVGMIAPVVAGPFGPRNLAPAGGVGSPMPAPRAAAARSRPLGAPPRYEAAPTAPK